MNPFRPWRQGEVIVLADSILKNANFGHHATLKAIPGANIGTFIDLIRNRQIRVYWRRVGLVILHLGTNDVDDGNSGSIRPWMEELIQLIRSNNRHIAVIISGILPRPVDHDYTKGILKTVNGVLQIWSATQTGIHFYQSYRPYLYKPIGASEPLVLSHLFSRRCELHLTYDGLQMLVMNLKNQINLFKRADILRSQ